MSDLERRGGGGGMTRAAREKRAYQLVVAGGVSGAVAVVGMVLAIAGVIGGGIPLLAGLVAVLCLVLFRRTVR